MFISEKNHEAIVSKMRADHMEAQRKAANEHNRELHIISLDHEIEMKRQKIAFDIKEADIMANVRKANNDAQLTKENAALVAERITADAESRIATAEKAASVVLSNAQLEAQLLIKKSEAEGAARANEIIKVAYAEAQLLLKTAIDNVLTRMPIDSIKMSEVSDLIASATKHFPSVTGDVTIKN